MSVAYDVGDGELVRAISPRAMVAWELATKQKISDFANGISIGDLSTLLFEQMRVDGDAPGTKAELIGQLVDIGPKVADVPTSLGEEVSSDSSSS